MIEPDALQRALEAAFPGSQVQITDLTGTRDHYQVSIVAEAFRGQSRMQQHRLVYRALGELVGGAIHALSLQTSAPAQ
ncbi:MAG TPA: BolA family transcriptional regulator [Polyangiaceae bacterium]|jgi:stress-induced morphogen|nr:BolA family transcriptional regulator [Polyangiaceae bacterium]